MAADSLLCPFGAKSNLTGQQGLHGAMDVTGEGVSHPSSKGRGQGHSAGQPAAQDWASR